MPDTQPDPSSILYFPDEILVSIIRYSSISSQRSFSETCRKLQKIIKEINAYDLEFATGIAISKSSKLIAGKSQALPAPASQSNTPSNQTPGNLKQDANQFTIYSIPDEILIKIFNMVTFQTNEVSQKTNPVSLSHVCARFSALYDSEPILTNMIDLLWTKSKKNCTQKLSWQVARASNYITSLSLDISRLDANYAVIFVKNGLNHLKSIQLFDATENQDFNQVLAILGMCGPELVKLSFISVDGFTSNIVEQIGERFPNLESLEFTQCLGGSSNRFPSDPSKCSSCFTKLKSLLLDDSFFMDFTVESILKRAKELENLVYCGALPASSILVYTNTCTKLKSLTIEIITAPIEDSLYERFCILHPDLEELFLSSATGKLEYSETLLRLMGRYLKKLKSLFLDRSTISDSQLIELLTGRTLNTVQISNCMLITLSGFSRVFKSLSLHEPLKLEFSCWDFDAKCLKELIATPGLEIESLRVGRKVHLQEDLVRFIESQPKLKLLGIDAGYSKDVIKALRSIMTKDCKLRVGTVGC